MAVPTCTDDVHRRRAPKMPSHRLVRSRHMLRFNVILAPFPGALGQGQMDFRPRTSFSIVLSISVEEETTVHVSYGTSVQEKPARGNTL